jgi:heme-degrading monooxygenase HmoA
MILELAVLHVVPGRADEFRQAFRQAEPLIAAAAGHLGHELHRCLEDANRFLLLVRWRSLEDHTRGFRGSPDYQRWRALLHHFYDPFPEVLHFEPETAGGDGPAATAR